MADTDAELFARLRTAAGEIDPVPRDLVDRVIAAIAVSDISREYALLTLIENAEAEVRGGEGERGDGETTTLQFSDGSATILLHVTHTERGRRRVDGWVDAGAVEVRLTQDDRTWTTAPDDQGRFAFEDVAPGLSRVRLVVGGDQKDLLTPHFEV
ncbi:hypothetical protein [Microbacterium abyssi]|uniref:hypothetical protein n=1 Tax=Microbacterium abyssi TaxID=2782166 RepID=UPI001889BE8C|nr:hypothetical protein [Microbacterium sp. A18JL241]